MKSSTFKVAAAASAVALAVAFMPAAQANETNTSLAELLDIGNAAFDTSNTDYDILTAAINAVLAAKPTSAVSVLADGDTALTAFIPTDGAFRKLAWQLGERQWRTMSESAVFAAVAGLGIDNVEKVLLHHVVVGPAVNLKAAVAADGATLESALGQDLQVSVATTLTIHGSVGGFWQARVSLNRTDINEGNLQLAHGINNVMVPVLD